MVLTDLKIELLEISIVNVAPAFPPPSSSDIENLSILCDAVLSKENSAIFSFSLPSLAVTSYLTLDIRAPVIELCRSGVSSVRM